MRWRTNILIKLGTFIIASFLYCEYLIYYIVIIQCSWPVLNNLNIQENEAPVYAMLLADTHLLGSRNGHWFDKLRREWQMHRAFQTAVSLHRPEVVFVLGDLFDEGLWSSGVEFNSYVERFNTLFSVPQDTKIYIAVGNHDVGFHYKITPYLADRFSTQLKSPPIQLISIRGNHFVIINSMAMEGDGCFLCHNAENALNNITAMLRCTKGSGSCQKTQVLSKYSKPILLQHFPLYRVSDDICTESDAAPLSERSARFRERWDCLSREATEYLIDNLQPRVALGGHTHHACYIQHTIDPQSAVKENFIEYSIPSFSWRNRNNPSFMLGVFTPHNYKISKCKLPQESTVIFLYCMFGVFILIYLSLYIGKKVRSYNKYF